MRWPAPPAARSSSHCPGPRMPCVSRFASSSSPNSLIWCSKSANNVPPPPADSPRHRGTVPVTNMSQKMRPIRETIPLDTARRLIGESIATIDRVERVPLAPGRRAGSSPATSPREATYRHSRARAWTATPLSPRTRSSPAASSRRRFVSSNRSSRAKCQSAQVRSRPRGRDRHRRPDARRRRRGRDGRGDRACQ